MYDLQVLIKHLMKLGSFGTNDHLNNLVCDINSSILRSSQITIQEDNLQVQETEIKHDFANNVQVLDQQV